jgi:GT2 family glycosyltransferase
VSEPRIATKPHVYVILLNWNGWQDTIECLESVFRMGHPSFTVIVCDNASSNGSLEQIENWANGRIAASCSSSGLVRLVLPPIPKPIAFVSLPGPQGIETPIPAEVRLILIQTGFNLGFAGGNNVGARFALGRDDCDYVWLLNNDTVVDPDALSSMVQTMETNPKLGICGSLLRGYAPPHEILSAGGRRYSRWSARTRPLQQLSTPRISTEPGAPDYIEGASMLIRRSFLHQVGLLEESYFLYFEELDLAERAKPGFHFGYSPRSVVYHKEGASIGSASVRANRSSLSDFYQARNRMVFTRRYHPWFLPSVLAATALSALQRIIIGRPQNGGAILRGASASFNRTRSKGQAFY